jgi:UDP-N-acetylglucosamine 4,6-dehydratase/5-epimerase
MLKYKKILITGGTGSFGRAFIHLLLKKLKIKNIERLVIYSRDEFKQSQLSNIYPAKKYPFIRFFIGDVKDKDRLNRALQNIDLVIHAAALKQVPAAEYNPFEFIKTNIIGAQNVIDASLNNKVSNVIALSTDKASSPINLYGATKLCSDKLFTSAENYKGFIKIKFSVIRYGNVFGSRGSVIPLFLNQIKNKIPITVTDLKMTRFSLSLDEASRYVLSKINNNKGGEVFVPKLPSYKVQDLVKALGKNLDYKIIGVRSGEKLHEEMISQYEGSNTLEGKKDFVILGGSKNLYKNSTSYKPVKKGFAYGSLKNTKYLSITQIKKLIESGKDILEYW